jgi:hypothetical protein
MLKTEKHVSASNLIILVLVLVNAVILEVGFTQNENLYPALIITVPLLLFAVYDGKQKRHAIPRTYPIIGRLRYFFESIRPTLRQYFSKII